VDRIESDHEVAIRWANTPLNLTVSVEGSTGLKVESIEKITSSAGWRLHASSQAETRTLGNGRVRWEQYFKIEPIVAVTAAQPAHLPLQLTTLRYRSQAEATDTVVEWKPIQVLITSDVLKANLSELRPITPPEDIPVPPSWWRWLPRWLPWIGLGVALVGLVAGAWQMRRRAAGATPLPPQRWALRELDQLERQDLPARGEVERFHTLLSDLVRAYLEKRFRLPASHQTTVEFLETMRRSPQLSPSQQGLLRNFLQRCDMAKFARAAPAPEECRDVAAMARSLISGEW
jgi:hypothetical protein